MPLEWVQHEVDHYSMRVFSAAQLAVFYCLLGVDSGVSVGNSLAVPLSVRSAMMLELLLISWSVLLPLNTLVRAHELADDTTRLL